jgi:hypothetical protein
MVEEVIGRNRILDQGMAPGETSATIQLSENSMLSVEKITKALGRKLSDNNDILSFTITVENLSEGYKTFAILDGPQPVKGGKKLD